MDVGSAAVPAPAQPQREEREGRAPAEVVAVTALERPRVTLGVGGARVAFLARVTAFAIALPAHELPLGPELEPVAEQPADDQVSPGSG